MSEFLLDGRLPNKVTLSGSKLSVWKYWQAQRTSRPIDDIDDSLEPCFRSLDNDFSLLRDKDFSLRLSFSFVSFFGFLLSKLSDDLPLFIWDFFISLFFFPTESSSHRLLGSKVIRLFTLDIFAIFFFPLNFCRKWEKNTKSEMVRVGNHFCGFGFE